MASKPASLKEQLSGALPSTFRCKVRYVHSPPKPCDPLFSPPPGSGREKTRLTSHFLAVSISLKPSSNEKAESDVLVLGIEALVYSTKHLTTVFVSKADSTGYLPQQRPSPARTIFATFLRWLVDQERLKHPSRKLVISLFARSQSQYLFPGSAENGGKHVLDDRQLIKWWARVLDPIFPNPNAASEDTHSDIENYSGYITVPGYEKGELRQFFPPNNPPTATRPRWNPGNPLSELAESRGVPADAPPRCLLPRFPDDPKARFMQDLDDEVGISDGATTASPSKRRSGKWSAIRDLERFWEAMEFRQECSSGRLVGFIWLVVRPALVQKGEQVVDGASQESIAEEPSSDPPVSQDEPSATRTPAKRRRKPLTGPIVARQPRLKGGSSSLTATSDLSRMLDGEVGDGVVLSREGYDKAMQTLLHLDFSTREAAGNSTSKWVSDVSAVGGFQAGWAMEVVGTAPVQASTATTAGVNGEKRGEKVNDLGSMVRKKRKVEDGGDGANGKENGNGPAVNVLGAGMVRKKVKATS